MADASRHDRCAGTADTSVGYDRHAELSPNRELELLDGLDLVILVSLASSLSRTGKAGSGWLGSISGFGSHG